MFKFVVLAFLLGVACADHINKDAEITSYTNEVNHDGTYKYSFDASNGISAQESGTGGVSVSGKSHWVSPEGIQVDITYVADENGYQPHGDVLPVGPPVPEAILRSLEYIRTHPPKDEPQHRKF